MYKLRKIFSYCINKWNHFKEIIERNHVALQFILSIATVLIAFILYLVTQRQVTVAFETLESQKIQWRSDSISQHIKDSITIAIAETSAAIGRRTMASNEKAIKIQTSPYISLYVKVPQKIEVGKDFNFEAVFDNTGLSAAFDFSAGWAWAIGTKSEINQMFDTIPIDIKPRNAILSPQRSKTIYSNINSINITDKRIEKIKDGIFDLKIRMTYEYNTQWGEHKRFTEIITYVYWRNTFMSINDAN